MPNSTLRSSRAALALASPALASPALASLTLLAGIICVLATSQAALGEEAKHELTYKFTANKSLVTKVVHLANTETTINGNTQQSMSSTESERVWKVEKVDKDGTATLLQSVRSVRMSQKLPQRPEVTFDSLKDEIAPADFAEVPDSIGKPLSRIVVNAHGEVIDRKEIRPNAALPGLGQVVTPLPVGPVAIDAKWYFPTEVQVRTEKGIFRTIKTRQQYTLLSVTNDVAKIALKTQVLTPINDRQLEVQLVQQITNGFLYFDIAAGQLISKQIDWNEKVVGYRGGDSQFQLAARYTEATQTK
jgi:hypothetical protein